MRTIIKELVYTKLNARALLCRDASRLRARQLQHALMSPSKRYIEKAARTLCATPEIDPPTDHCNNKSQRVTSYQTHRQANMIKRSTARVSPLQSPSKDHSHNHPSDSHNKLSSTKLMDEN